MSTNRYQFLRNAALAGLVVLLTACSPSANIKASSPYISLHPVKTASQVQVSLRIVAPAPNQYINANALLANSDTHYASSAAAAINNYQNPPSSLSSSSSASSGSSSAPGVTTGSYALPPGISTSLGSNVPPATVQTQSATAPAAQTSSHGTNKDTAALTSAKIHAIATLRPEIENVMSQYGFVVVPYQPQLQRKLTVQIVSLSNSSGLQMTIEMDAINGMLTYSRSYTGSASLVSIGSLNDRTARLFGDLLTQALGDSQLINFLNQP